MGRTVFIMLADTDGTLHSKMEPIGVAIDNKVEAERFVSSYKDHYYRLGYQEMPIMETALDAHTTIEMRHKAQMEAIGGKP